MIVALLLVGLLVVLAVVAWWLPTGGQAHLAAAVAILVGVAIAAGIALWGAGAAALSNGAYDTLVVVAGALAVAGGGPLTVAVFKLVDRGVSLTDRNSVEAAGAVLRGGAWIGGLERGAVFVTLASGWPEGLAVILALKGLGRYPDLRSADHLTAHAGTAQAFQGVPHGVAERFIIGTFVSVLWAVLCAGLLVL